MIYRKKSVLTKPLSSRLKTAVPNLNIIQRDEHNLDDCIDELFKTAIETTEKIRIE